MDFSLALDGELLAAPTQGISSATPAPGGRQAWGQAPMGPGPSDSGDMGYFPPPDPFASPRSLWHCASQGHTGALRVQFNGGGAVTGGPLAAASRRSAADGRIPGAADDDADDDTDAHQELLQSVTRGANQDGGNEEDEVGAVVEGRRVAAALRPAPPCRLLRAMSQGSTLLRRSRRFRREETGEPGPAITPGTAAETAPAPCGPAAPVPQAPALPGGRPAFRPAAFERPGTLTSAFMSQQPPAAARRGDGKYGGNDGEDDVVPSPCPVSLPKGPESFAQPDYPHHHQHRRQRALSTSYLVSGGIGIRRESSSTPVPVPAASASASAACGDGAAAAGSGGGAALSSSPRRRRSSALRGDEGCFCSDSDPPTSSDDDDGGEGLSNMLRPAALRPGINGAAAASSLLRASPSACGEHGHLVLVSDSSADVSSSGGEGDNGGGASAAAAAASSSSGLRTPRISKIRCQQQQPHVGIPTAKSNSISIPEALPVAMAEARSSMGCAGGGSGSGGGVKLVRIAGVAAATAAGADAGLSRRRSEHGNARRGRRQQERRRASCWTVADELGDQEEEEEDCSTGGSSSGEESGDGGCMLHGPSAVSQGAAQAGRPLRPPATAVGTLFGSRRNSTLYSLGGGVAALLATAPACIPAAVQPRGGGGGGVGARAIPDPTAAAATAIPGSLLFHSLQEEDFPWPPASPREEAKTGSGALLPPARMLRPLSFRGASEQVTGALPAAAAAGKVLSPSASGSAVGQGDEEPAPRQAWGTGTGSGSVSQRSSLEAPMAGDPMAVAAAAAAAHRAALKGWSSRSLLTPPHPADGGGRRRTGVGFVGLEDEAPSPKAVPSPRALKPLAPTGVGASIAAAAADGGSSERWRRRALWSAAPSAADSDGSLSDGEGAGGGGVKGAVRASVATQAGAEQRLAPGGGGGGGFRLPRLHRLLHPSVARSHAEGASPAAAWHTRAKSSGALQFS